MYEAPRGLNLGISYSLSLSHCCFLFKLVYLDQCHTPRYVNDIQTRHRTATLDLRPLPRAHQPVHTFNVTEVTSRA